MNNTIICGCTIEQLFLKPYGSMHYGEKKDIIETGRPTPELPLLTFQYEYYSKYKWLAGCKKTNKLYCWPCIMESSEENVWTKYGFDDLNNFHHFVSRHEASISHIECLIHLTRFGTSYVWTWLGERFRKRDEEHNVTVKNNRYILRSMIDSTCFLVQQELAFRGHDELDSSVNTLGPPRQRHSSARTNRRAEEERPRCRRHSLTGASGVGGLNGGGNVRKRKKEVPWLGGPSQWPDFRGNYVELIYLMAERDELLKTLLATSNILTNLSEDFQNDLIQSVSDVLLKQIENEIRDTPFVAMIIMDETTDIVSKSLQLSTVLRYVNTSNSNEVVERFLGFTDVSKDRSAKALSEHVFGFILKYACEEKLIGQTYIMSEQHDGLQSLVRSKYENAIPVHCYAHELNLVIKQSVEYIKDCKIFFSTLSGLSSFFSTSTKLVHALDNIIKKRLRRFRLGFKSEAPTRWNYNSRIVEMMVDHKVDVIDLMESIIDNAQSWDSETWSSAKGYVEILQSFDFNFFLKLFSIILPQATNIFKNLQQKCFDISYCSKEIDEFIAYLNNVRSNFDDIWSQLKIINNEILQPQTRRSKRKRFNQVSGDKKTYYRRLFFEIIDVIISKIKERFSNLNQLQFFALLDSKKFSLYANDFPINLFNSLEQLYGKYFDLPKLRSELSVVYSMEVFLRPTSVHDLSIYLKTRKLDENLPQATKLISLILTIPATSALEERSFSALNRIKNSSRNSHEQDHLSSLSVLSIEKELLVELKKKPTFHDEVIETFLTKNTTIDLTYKSVFPKLCPPDF